MVRVVACDDGRVAKLGEGYTIYACVAYEGLNPIGCHIGLLRIDGLEASSLLAYSSLIASGGLLDYVLLDSITIAGFNLASPPTIKRLTGAPVIVVYTYKPSSERLLRPLYTHFKRDFTLREQLIRLVDSAVKVRTSKGVLYLLTWSVNPEKALEVVEALQAYSRVPEPLRVAHMIASQASLIKT